MRRLQVESWEQLIAEEQASWESIDASLSEEPSLDDLLASCDAYEELHCGDRELDQHRWELDPASAEDFGEHDRFVRTGPSRGWRDFDH